MDGHIHLFIVFICGQCCEGFLDFIFNNHNNTSLHTKNGTAVVLNQPRQDVEDVKDFGPVKREAGTIAGTVFGIILCVAFVSVIGFIYIRRKRERDAEYQRQAKVQLRSTQYAGVYGDMTSDYSMTSKPRHTGAGPEYNALNSRNRADLYENDSEDELWTSYAQKK